RVLVEFVSANPTGPLNVVNARAAAFGDALVRVLNAAGYRAEREYYVNDAGRQFANLALAMEVRLRQLLGEDIGLPEGAYPGAYVIDLARAFLAEHGADVLNLPAAERRERLGRFAVDRIVAGQRATLEAYGVHFDRWVRESAVRAAGEPERVLALLREAGHVYERDGAVWFRATAFGDDQDRVLVRQNGEATYFLPDVAYHLDKFRRDYDLCIDIWGQDHHGYVARMKAALSALGIDPARLEVLLTQIVRLLRGGQVVKMSKRGGEFVTMDELLEDVGRDAARFFFLMRTLDSHLDFDLDLAVRQSEDNPVYYVQYAHARICSILRQGAERGVAPPPPGTADLTLLADPSEEAVVRLVARFPAEVAEAAEGRAPHRLTAYCRELATAFHAFYARCRVLGEDPDLTTARLALVDAVRQVLANALELLGVSAPERM
ncbi:MAG: arginine--tRNA ligase, partial [Clostridia bacterium]|nr:arginine--tRNA ligase [Clostridia bacterium]